MAPGSGLPGCRWNSDWQTVRYEIQTQRVGKDALTHSRYGGRGGSSLVVVNVLPDEVDDVRGWRSGPEDVLYSELGQFSDVFVRNNATSENQDITHVIRAEELEDAGKKLEVRPRQDAEGYGVHVLL